MDIIVLSLVAGLVVAGGLWMATRPTKPIRTSGNSLENLLSEMPDGLPRAPGWDDMPDVGKEAWPAPEGRQRAEASAKDSRK